MLDNRVETPTSMSALVGGIISDAQQLIRQELMLARRELQDEVKKAKTAAISFAVGAFVALVGSALLCLMVVYFLNWATNLPLWGCFGIVGGLLALLGLILLLVARNKASEIHLVPPQTAATLKENVQWIKNQT